MTSSEKPDQTDEVQDRSIEEPSTKQEIKLWERVLGVDIIASQPKPSTMQRFMAKISLR